MRTEIETLRRRYPIDAAAIAKMTPTERAHLAGMMGEALARQHNRRDMLWIVLTLLFGVVLAGGIAIYAV